MARSKSKSSKRRGGSVRRPRRVWTKKRSMNHKKGGGCGCGAGLGNGVREPTAFFTGGDPTPGLGQLAGRNYYPLNSQNADPNYFGIATRQTENILVRGGKRRRGSRSTRKRGGANISGAMINGLSMATSSSLVGADSYSSAPNFFSLPYERYTAANPPLA
jgi:hypothetical protein